MDNTLIINSLDLQIKSMLEDIRKKKKLLSELLLKRLDLLEETISTNTAPEEKIK